MNIEFHLKNIASILCIVMFLFCCVWLRVTVCEFVCLSVSPFCSGSACFPLRWCELLVGHPLRDVRVDHFSYL